MAGLSLHTTIHFIAVLLRSKCKPGITLTFNHFNSQLQLQPDFIPVLFRCWSVDFYSCYFFSIVHSEEEVAGSYNWDYLLDWGPQYQPLAHVFHEISALKDESGSSDARVPPIITCRPPRHVHAPLQSHVVSQARSPLSHEMMSQSAMSPSFSPALSPLATRSPSISPLGVSGPGMGPVSSRTNVTRGITLQNHYNDYSDLANSEAELRIWN